MPITPQNFELFRSEVLENTRESLISNNDAEFSAWLGLEAEIEFSNIYAETLLKHYFGTFSETVEDRLLLLGKTTIYVARAFVSVNQPLVFTNLLEFVDAYINAQMDNFDIDFDEEIHWVSDAEDHDPC